MYLKRLELAGFKSFPDRIRLDFNRGLTAVVGPNGSGKSNIADAIRWVMGEQSAKSLRGQKMEDIIFSGTEFRKPLGYAEVIMTVDNVSRILPLEFDDVVITRRVYRSGESEFMLNGANCRLKDIQMLFMDTGVGREGYSIIGQGKIDEILSIRSEDRRNLFEEAAGIVKFRARRNEALTKLERKRQNLVRVNDIIEELNAQLEPLAIQAEEAKKWLYLKEQLKSMEINIFLDEINKTQAELERIDEGIADIVSQSESGHTLLSETRAANLAMRESAASADIKYKLANENLVNIATEIEKKESDIKLYSTQIEHENQNRVRMENERKNRESAITQKQKEREEEERLIEQITGELSALDEDLQKRQSEFANFAELISEREAALDEFNRAILEQVSKSAEIRSRIREEEALYLRLESEKERLDMEIQNQEALYNDEHEKMISAQKSLAENENNYSKNQQMLTAYKEAREQLSEEYNSLAGEQKKTREEYQILSSRHKALTQLETHFEGYYKSVKAILKKKASDPQFAGIHGAVSELVSTKSEYEVAIEVALGGAAQNIVTETESEAKAAIEFLKKNREGRATFLPLTTIKGRTEKFDIQLLKKEPGYVGTAASLAEYDPKYKNIMQFLLGGIIIVNGLENGLLMQKKNKNTLRLVTLEGEYLSPGGAITGGSAPRSGLIGRGRQIAELKGKIDIMAAELNDREKELTALEEKINATDEVFDAAREDGHALMTEQNNLRAQLGYINEKIVGFNETLKIYANENDQIMEKLVEVNKKIRDEKAELTGQENEVEVTKHKMEEYKNTIEDSKDEKDEYFNSLTEIKVEMGRKKESLNICASVLERLGKEAEKLVTEMNILSEEHAKSLKITDEKNVSIDKTNELIDSLKTRLTGLKDEITEIENEKSILADALMQAEADERVHVDDNARLDRENDRLIARKEQLEAENRRYYDEIWEDYGLTLQTAAQYKRNDISMSAIRREEKRIKGELSQIDNVNVGAIESHKTMQTRYDFLTTQRDDIEKAEEDLLDVVNKLTEHMESRFYEQFVIISKHFSEVFKEMFGGGKASLSLLDEKNVLESGIEITAQPPGKSLQTLLLLSGGEKALTAIALLFAILRMKPSPFCVLDEIEAALDDANITRFSKFVREYSGNTQFIIITHRKGTMEGADVLYGVTMQEQGISKMVSVKLTDSE